MKKIFFLAVVLSAAIVVNGQNTERVTVRAGETLAVAFPNGFYRFPNFTEGTFLMKDGTKSRAKFNYNIATGEVQYLKSNGDTMAIGVPEDMVYVNIGDNTQYIYSNKSYYEVLAEANDNKLAKKIKVSMEKDKKGGYGESAPTSSTDQLANFTWGSQLYHLSHDVIISKTTSFYWVDKKNNSQPATRKNAMKLVSRDKQSKLEAFIDENKTNFNSEDDLRKLLAYAGTL